jgi:putative FmdB family regulatory protein
MPIYEYACAQCGKVNDVLQKVNDPAPEACVECGAQGALSRVVSRTSFVLKGGGWYSDLYGSVKKDGSKGGESSSSSTPSTPSSESKSSTASSPAPAAAASGTKA